MNTPIPVKLSLPKSFENLPLSLSKVFYPIPIDDHLLFLATTEVQHCLHHDSQRHDGKRGIHLQGCAECQVGQQNPATSQGVRVDGYDEEG